jgi:pilus assembly protein CpaF
MSSSTSVADLYQKTLKYLLDPIWEKYVENSAISEIMVNGTNEVYVEQGGQVTLTDAKFPDEARLMAAVRNVAQYTGKRITPETNRFDSRLPDGSRVHVVLPPCSRNGIVISIRKFPKRKIDLDRLVEYGSLTPEAKEFLQVAVALDQNIIASGGTSSGKTSLLNAMAGAIPAHQRILVLEDSSELQIPQEHVLYFEARTADRHGRGAAGIRELFHSTLRMRPDRIIIGEIRGGEALDLIQAMTSGHSGSMSTLHANNPKDALNRLETMALMSGIEMPLFALRSQVASAIDLIVQTSRMPNGSRRITHISEVLPLTDRGEYQIQDLFVFKTGGKAKEWLGTGKLCWTGIAPTFANELWVHGLESMVSASAQVFGAEKEESDGASA